MTRDLEQGFLKPVNKGRANSCPYCQGKVPSKKKEHIFNASWGGKRSSKKLICDHCNKHFGETIDLAFKSIVDNILNLWNMAPNRSRKVPDIQIDEDIFLGAFNTPYRSGVKFDFQENDNKYDFSISAGSRSEIKRFIDNGGIEKAIGKPLTDEHKLKMKAQLKNHSN